MHFLLVSPQWVRWLGALSMHLMNHTVLSSSVQNFSEAQLSVLKWDYYLLRKCFCVPICPIYFQMYLGKIENRVPWYWREIVKMHVAILDSCIGSFDNACSSQAPKDPEIQHVNSLVIAHWHIMSSSETSQICVLLGI